MTAPLRLAPDNFTPPARTPWGGHRIRGYKAALGLAEGPPVGESWEISVEPSFPSRTAEGALLAEVIAADPVAWLGEELARRHGQTPLLVKLLDAADDLSLQVHPAEGDPALAPGESGKPEAWLVLHAEPGAGLYLGFREGVERADVARCVATGGALDELMSFVRVAEGDAFRIDAGTPHAIGRGLTLLEPQLVMPGRRGVTYRYWDWNRRYDESGNLDPSGAPRELHLERSLAVTAWDAPRGADFVARCRLASEPLAAEGLERTRFVAGDWLVAERWRGSGREALAPAGTLLGIVCVAGSLRLAGASGTLRLSGGESGVVPAVAGALELEGQDLLAFALRSPRAAPAPASRGE